MLFNVDGAWWLERAASSMGAVSSNPEACTLSRIPNTCEERGLSGCRKGQALLSKQQNNKSYSNIQSRESLNIKMSDFPNNNITITRK